eukprot:Polyplicarium_translucidae@DN3274_c15_g1_i1.p1
MGDCGIMIAQAQSKEVAHDANADVGMQTTVRLPADLFLREREMCDLEMLVMGAFAPVTGYMTRRDYHSVLHTMRLTSGEVFPIPIVLPVPKSETTAAVDAENRTPSAKPQVIKLRDKVGAVIAEVHVKGESEKRSEPRGGSVCTSVCRRRWITAVVECWDRTLGLPVLFGTTKQLN